MKIVCEQCGAVRHVPECRAHIQHCSRHCFEESRKLDVKWIHRMLRMGYTKRQMAIAVGLSYPQFNRRFERDIVGAGGHEVQKMRRSVQSG